MEVEQAAIRPHLQGALACAYEALPTELLVMYRVHGAQGTAAAAGGAGGRVEPSF